MYIYHALNAESYAAFPLMMHSSALQRGNTFSPRIVLLLLAGACLAKDGCRQQQVFHPQQSNTVLNTQNTPSQARRQGPKTVKKIAHFISTPRPFFPLSDDHRIRRYAGKKRKSLKKASKVQEAGQAANFTHTQTVYSGITF